MDDQVLYGYIESVFGEYTIIDKNRIRFPKLLGGLSELFDVLGIHLLFVWSKNCLTDFLVTDKGKYLISDAKVGLYMNALSFPDVIKHYENASFEDLLFEAIAYMAAGELLFMGHPKMCAYINKQYVKHLYYNAPVGAGEAINKILSVLLHEWGHYISKVNSVALLENMSIVEDAFNDFCNDKANMYFDQKDYNKSMWYNTVYRNKFKDNKVDIECCADLFGFEHALLLMKQDDMFKMLSGGIDRFAHDSLVSIHQFLIIEYVKVIVKSAIAGNEYDFKKKGSYNQRLRITRDIFSRRLINEVGLSVAKKSHAKFTEYLEKYDNPVDDMLRDLHRIIFQNRNVFNESEDTLVVNEKCQDLYKWPPLDMD